MKKSVMRPPASPRSTRVIRRAMTTEIEVKKKRRRTRRRRRPTAAKELPQIFFAVILMGVLIRSIKLLVSISLMHWSFWAICRRRPLEVVLEEALQYAPVGGYPAITILNPTRCMTTCGAASLPTRISTVGLPMSAVYALRVWAAFFAARFGCLMIPQLLLPGHFHSSGRA